MGERLLNFVHEFQIVARPRSTLDRVHDGIPDGVQATKGSQKTWLVSCCRR